MRILANENVAGETVAALRRLGHDVAWIAADAAGASDRQVLQRAADEDRTIVTFDKDFGELAFREGLRVSTGVILLRVQAKDPTTLTQIGVDAHRRAISAFETPSVAHNNALAWRTSRAGAVCERARRSRSARCPPVISKAPAAATIPPTLRQITNSATHH